MAISQCKTRVFQALRGIRDNVLRSRRGLRGRIRSSAVVSPAPRRTFAIEFFLLGHRKEKAATSKVVYEAEVNVCPGMAQRLRERDTARMRYTPYAAVGCLPFSIGADWADLIFRRFAP
jgi:hypothetical protein